MFIHTTPYIVLVWKILCISKHLTTLDTSIKGLIKQKSNKTLELPLIFIFCKLESHSYNNL